MSFQFQFGTSNASNSNNSTSNSRSTPFFNFTSNNKTAFNALPSNSAKNNAVASSTNNSAASLDKQLKRSKKVDGNSNRHDTESKNENSAMIDNLDEPKRIIQKQKPDEIQTFTQEDIALTGTLFTNPEALGFRKQNKHIPSRPIPKFFFTQPKYLTTVPFTQNEWDKQNQIKMEQMEAANQGKDYQGLYEELQKLREVERKEMEKLGLVDAENIAKSLNDAIAFRGSCLDMCPVFERVRRQLENNVKNLEKDPQTNKISKERAIKAFSRPAAGQPPPLPSEVRPPHVLVETLDYLIEEIVNKLPDAHSFLWDRTRSIRQDFTYQNSFGPEAVDCNEKIVRIHLLSLHIMAGSDVEYSQQQELEQFNKALQTLMEIYQDVRNNGGKCANEAEFRAYHLLSHIRDPDLERQIQNLPNEIYNASHVQIALQLRKLASQNNVVERGVKNLVGALNMYVEFFRTVYNEQTPLLIACLLETQFSEIRFYALKAMARSFHSKGKGYSLLMLQDALGFDSSEKLLAFLKYYEIETIEQNGEVLVDLFNQEKLKLQYKLNSFQEKPKYPPVYSRQIDQKINGHDLKHFITSGFPNTTFNLNSDSKKAVQPYPFEHDFKPSPSITPTTKITAAAVAATAKTPATFQSISRSNGAFQPNKIMFQQPLQTTTPQSASAFQFGGVGGSRTTAQEKKQNPLVTTATAAAAAASATPILTKPVTMITSDKPAPTKVDFSSFSKSLPGKSEDMFASKKVTFNSIPEVKIISSGGSEGIPSSTSSSPPPPPPPSHLSAQESGLITAASIQKSSAAVPPVKKKTLIENSQFPKALRDYTEEISKNIADSELETFLRKIFFSYKAQVERRSTIKALSSDLYLAFLSEVIYECTSEVIAREFSDNLSKKHTLEKIVRNARRCVESYRQRKLKGQEFSAVSFTRGSKRRVSSSSVVSSHTEDSIIKKRRQMSRPISNLDISKKRKEMKELWSPLDLKKFIDACADGIQLKIDEDNLELTCLLVVEDWQSSYSQWLNSKFSLRANMKSLVYEGHANNDKIELSITSLPGKKQFNKEFFSKCSFILFEFGLTTFDSGKKTIHEKLALDYKVLKNILSWVDKYSYYKVHIIILLWDISDSGISSAEAISELKLTKFLGSRNVKDVVFCNMSSEKGTINDIFSQAWYKIAHDFNAELTLRGQRHTDKLRKLKNINLEEEHQRQRRREEISGSNNIKQLESEMLNRAKRLRAFENLTSTAGTRPRPSLNPSLNPSANPLPRRASNQLSNSSAIVNKSIAQIISQRNNRSNVTSASSNSTFFNTTMINSANGSILNGFGRGVVEESTPINSPKRNSNSTLDLNLSSKERREKLRETVASIKNKYKRSTLSKEGDSTG
ncbi:SAC3 [Candida oxycetoniae]|uniref:Nuclear mRNA export factor n=1 Tax=Candida oxycetoniae TaxID=497107 RepID=A0AAI9T1A1_9ASCO|nr:SAC3 [Candida oxycetoniae]KAI3406754.2 SAC3 [Candida oxycetoniae]